MEECVFLEEKIWSYKDDDVKSFIAELIDFRKNENPFYVVDLSSIITQYKKWLSLLPNITPFYAVKCNPDENLLKLLDKLGCNFDCASKNEIGKVLALSSSKNPEKIIYANPCKSKEHLLYAKDNGVKKLTFDCVEELHKIKEVYPEAELILRIQVDDSKSLCKFNTKFGCAISDAEHVLYTSSLLKLNVIGVSFHVGSGCKDCSVYKTALNFCKVIFDIGTALNFNMKILDIGGGFPGSKNKVSFEDVAQVLKENLDFPDYVQVISEPGRFIAEQSHTLVLNVTGKKENVNELGEKIFMYYLNDGIYGSFNCIIFDYAKPEIKTFKIGELYKSIVFGPTCDSLDRIGEFLLPELDVSDWCYVENFGAYTSSAASTFNGFSKPELVYAIKVT